MTTCPTCAQVAAPIHAAPHEIEQRYRTLLASAEQQKRELYLRDTVRAAIASEIELAGIFRAVVEAISSAFGYTLVGLYLHGDAELALQHQVGYAQPIERIGLGQGIIGRVAATGAAVLLEDVRNDAAYLGAIEDVTSEICLPLFDQGRVAGVLNVESTGLRLTPADMTLLQAVCEQIGIAIGRARIYAEAQRERDFNTALVDIVDSLVVVLDRDGHIVRFNRACERSTGYSFEQVGGRLFWDLLLPPKYVEPARASFLEVLAGRSMAQQEFPWRTSTGQQRLIAWSAALLYDKAGAPEFVIGTGIDITERVLVEAALRENEATLRSFYDNTPLMMGVVELLDDDILHVSDNQATARMFQRTPEAMRNQRASAMGVSAEHLALWIANYRRSQQTGSPVSFEYQHVAPNQTSWLQVTVCPIVGGSGERPRFAYACQDVTEHKEVQVALARARDAALESSRLKSEFLATMSHEIRTPLNGVIGMAELLLGTALDADQNEFARTIDESAQALLVIINDILDYSKIEAGKMILDTTDVVLAEVIASVTGILSARVRAKNLTIVSEIGAHVPPVVLGDAGRLRQVLLNLIGNAVKFTEHGRITVRVTHEPEGLAGAMLRFSVSDTGIGIPAAVQHRLFQPFTQADGSVTRKYGGTGLGLAICKSLVELMGGTISCESVEGQGSTFWFRVGLAAAHTPALKPLRMPPPSAAPVAAERGCILLAEDHVVNQRLALRQLANLGFTIEIAPDGNAAVAMYAQNPRRYRMVLMDCHMPHLDGYGAAQGIRQFEHAAGGHIPIIAMTASVLQADRDACLAAGMDDFLSKPVRQEQLAAIVERWLDTGIQSPAALDSTLLDELLAFNAEDPALFRELVQTYLEEANVQLERMRAAAGSQDMHALKQAAHALRGSSSALGAARLAAVCAQLEADARSDDARGIPDTLARVEALFALARAELQANLEILP